MRTRERVGLPGFFFVKKIALVHLTYYQPQRAQRARRNACSG
jgi:hypothetical protein